MPTCSGQRAGIGGGLPHPLHRAGARAAAPQMPRPRAGRRKLDKAGKEEEGIPTLSWSRPTGREPWAAGEEKILGSRRGRK